MTERPKRSPWRSLASLLGVAIGVAGVLFVARTVLTRWDEVSDAFSQFDPLTLVASLALALGGLTIIGSTWARILRSRGPVFTTSRALSWYFTGQLGKYVPGGIWAIVGRAEMAVRAGVPRPDAYASTGVSMTTTYLASLVVVSLGSLLGWTYQVVGILIAVGLVIGFAVYAVESLHALVLRITGKFLPRGIVLTSAQDLMRFTILQVPAWILMSLSTSVTASAFGAEVSVARMFFFTAASWFIGFVAIGVPGGIGVRESVFTALATGTLGAPLAVSIALASRVVFITADVLGAVTMALVVSKTRETRPG